MKIEIDLDLCQGHGQCQAAAPTVFEVRDDGFAHLLLSEIPSALSAEVEEAVARCPVEAIRALP